MNNRQRLLEQLARYAPFNEQEARDREVMAQLVRRERDIFLRSCAPYHMTASAWIVNPGRTRVLMAYHKLYDSWAWLGGHADGQEDLLAVALREAREESGLADIRAVREDVFSLEVLPVNGHEKRGRYVSAHLHLNVTYLLEAGDAQPPRAKPDENSAVAWFSPAGAVAASSEAWMRERIYQKLNAKLYL